MNKLDKIAISAGSTIIEAIKAIDQGEIGIALVVNSCFQLIGVITDGDIRRALINNASLNCCIAQFMSTTPIKAFPETSDVKLKELMQSKSVKQVPIVDENNRLITIKTLAEIAIGPRKPNHLVIMAGGLGTRLLPLTNATPKPLLPVGNKPMLETIINHAKDYGICNIYISLNYLSQSIKSYFGDGYNFGVNIKYIEEDKNLGTAGALSLITEEITEELIVINGDILTKVNFDQFIEKHKSIASDLTVGIRPYKTQIPYGVMNIENNLVTSIEEKPVLQYKINAGIYVLSAETVKLIPQDCVFHMTDLIQKLLDSGGKVGSFLIEDYWLDIGKINDYYRANIEYNDYFI